MPHIVDGDRQRCRLNGLHRRRVAPSSSAERKTSDARIHIIESLADNLRRADRSIELAVSTGITASGYPPNRLLQQLDAADFDLPRPHLSTIE